MPLSPARASYPRPRKLRFLLAIGLFMVTLFATTTMGSVWYLLTRIDVVTDLGWFLTPRAIRTVWSNPDLLASGLAFSLPALLILLCHELGHYFACRYYGLPATLPYFLPAPLGLGTLGAFIRIRAPLRSKRELLDVGAAGPIAGVVALLPFLLVGVARSRPVHVVLLDPALPASFYLLLPGKCLALELITRLFHGPLGPGVVLDLHPFALAAWVGLFATALNLLPVGQLDGGHVLYATSPQAHRRLRIVFIALLLSGSFYWPGWLLWFLIVLAMGFRHPPVVDQLEPLGPGRRTIAAACLALLIVTFMPVPVSLLPIAG